MAELQSLHGRTVKTRFHLWRLEYREKVESTIDECANASHFLPHFSCIYTDEQTKGRGRQGKKWHCTPGKDLAMSLFVPLVRIPRDLWRTLSQAGALSVAEVLEKNGLATTVKWPNDVLVREKKICGVLCETRKHDGITMAIIGIGINVNSTHAHLQDAGKYVTSSREETGKTSDRTVLLREVLWQVSERFYQMETGNFVDVRRAIRQRLKNRGGRTTIAVGSEVHEGTIIDINENGTLRFHCDICGIMDVHSGEFVHPLPPRSDEALRRKKQEDIIETERDG